MNLLAELSEGYPHFIQQLRTQLLTLVRPTRITVDDVLDGAYGEKWRDLAARHQVLQRDVSREDCVRRLSKGSAHDG